MTANVYLVEYESFGGRKRGGPDDIGGASTPQIPGRIESKPRKIAVTIGSTETLDPRTTFVKLQTYDADCLFTFDTDGHAAIDDTNGDRMTPGQIIFQGVVDMRSGEQFITQVNLKETS